MNKQSKKTKNSKNIIIVFFLFAFLTGIFFTWQHLKPKKAESNILKKQEKRVSWKTYTNEKYGFEFKYPGNSEIQEDTNSISVNLSFTQDTKLTVKKMFITIKENVNPESCFTTAKWDGVRNINGIEFHYIKGFKWEHAMGGKKFFASDYLTIKENNCISIFFRLGLNDPTGFIDPSIPIPPDPPEKDLNTEIFDQILHTFRFLK